MASAFRFSGYDFHFVLGDGAHNGKHGGAILPESLRWLWRPEVPPPAPFTKDNLEGDEALSKILPPDSRWERVGGDYEFTDAACLDREGNFYFSDLPRGMVYRVTSNGSVEPWLEKGLKISGMKQGLDGTFFAATQGKVGTADEPKIVSIHPVSREVTEIAVQVKPNDLVVTRNGWIHFTDTSAGQVLMTPVASRSMARPRVAAGGITQPNGIALSPDERFLAVSEYGGTNVWSFYIDEKGGLNWGERYMTLQTVIGKMESGGDGMIADRKGRYFVTSIAGIQVFDSTGRLGGIIPGPEGKPCFSADFGGSQREWLYVCSLDKVWRRRVLE